MKFLKKIKKAFIVSLFMFVLCGDGEDYFVLSGMATLDDNHERTLYLKPGEHYFTPSGKGHSILNEQDEDLVFMALIIYDSQQKI